MKIYTTTINTEFPPSYEILLDVLKTLNPTIEEKEIIKEIKKLKLYDVPETTSKGAKGKKQSFTDDRNTDNIQ
jgi:hypothetical protein